MFTTAIIILLLIGALMLFFNSGKLIHEAKRGARVIAVAGIILALAISGWTSIYRQTVGEATVVVNAGGQISHENSQPGWAIKAPWQSLVDFDLFSQSLTYAGGTEAPSYTGGTVQGQEITASVARGVKVNFDVAVTYNLDGSKVAEIYEKYRSQENFTQQVIQQRTLAVLRDVPSAYAPVEFRGEKRGEAQSMMLARLKSELEPYGVDVTTVSLQAIRYEDSVEESLKAVEVAQQREAEAQANLRATEVSAQAEVVEAEAKAEANNKLTASLTPQVLQQKWIDAIRESKATIVVPDGMAPILNLPNTGVKD